MAGCDVPYFDPAQVGQVHRDSAGHPLGPASDGWRPCPAAGQVWTDPELVLRFVCAEHRRQLTALHAAGLAGRAKAVLPPWVTISSRSAVSAARS